MHDFNLITRNRITALAATALLVAACGGGTTPTPSPVATQAAPSTAPSAAASEAPSAEPSEAAEAYEVELGDNDKLGKFLTGEDGKTLYLFTPDADGKSACNAGCIDSWPAFTIEDDETVTGGEGVTGTFGTITRDDGSTQVTYAGHPLYYFTGDQAAGDVNGQGLGSKWYVVGADGNAIMKTTASGGGRY